MKKTSAPAHGASKCKEPRSITTTGDPVSAYSEAIARDTGATLNPIPDGKIHRFDCPEGRRGNQACWYVLHLDLWAAGAYGNWRTGVTYTWRADRGRKHSREERTQIAAAIEAAKSRRERERSNAHAKAARSAQRLWSDAQPATVDHPYLARKQIPALCLRQVGSSLLVPLWDMAGELVNIQRIHPDGTKRFLRGGRITGALALFARELPREGELYIAEGWATAATVATTLCLPVVAAMNAGNLAPVAQAIRAARPELALTIAADDDHRTPGNPGMTKAAEAARLVQAGTTWPTTCRQADCCCTDFNDVAKCERVSR